MCIALGPLACDIFITAFCIIHYQYFFYSFLCPFTSFRAYCFTNPSHLVNLRTVFSDWDSDEIFSVNWFLFLVNFHEISYCGFMHRTKLAAHPLVT